MLRFGRFALLILAAGITLEITQGWRLGFFGVVIGLVPLLSFALAHRANDVYVRSAHEFCGVMIDRVQTWHRDHGAYPRTLDSVGVTSMQIPRYYEGYYSDGVHFSITHLDDICRNYAAVYRTDYGRWDKTQIGF
jgi:hypothetical protein